MKAEQGVQVSAAGLRARCTAAGLGQGYRHAVCRSILRQGRQIAKGLDERVVNLEFEMEVDQRKRLITSSKPRTILRRAIHRSPYYLPGHDGDGDGDHCGMAPRRLPAAAGLMSVQRFATLVLGLGERFSPSPSSGRSIPMVWWAHGLFPGIEAHYRHPLPVGLFRSLLPHECHRQGA